MRTLFHFIILFVFFWSRPSAAVSSSVVDHFVDKMAKELHWQRLLYYQKTLFGSWESQIDAKNFFLASDGKTNPTAELRALLDEILRTDASQLKEEESAICRFPARSFWLKKKVNEQGMDLPWPKRECPRFQKWFEALRGTSASLVFSSYYLNNPSSTFGHTLLRINKAPSKDGRRYELLDYGVNFAANANTSNPLLYSFKGLFGGFPGTFTTVPYYYKVREYSNSESRDLWEYELNLSQEATDLLVMHIWEVGPAYSDYWYLTENCSYFMLALIEAADPKINLTSRLKKYVIPTDTVQIVYDTPGLVKSYHFRPSVRSELYARLEDLSDSEKKVLIDFVDNKSITPELKSLPTTRRRLVLDAAIDDMDYLYPVAVQKPDTSEWKFKNQILAERSKINEVTKTLNIPAPVLEQPHAGHGSRRLGLGYLTAKEAGNTLLLSYRFAFHDVLDPVVGFPEYAQITFFDLRFGYEERSNKVELLDFNLFEVLSLSPYSDFAKSISWRLKVAVEKLVNEDCWGCHAGVISGGAGYAYKFSEDPRVVGYLGLKLGIYYTDHEHRDRNFPRWMLGAGPNLVFRWRWREDSITALEVWYRKDAHVSYNEYKEISLSHQFSFGKNDGIRITGVERWFEKSASAEFFHYY